MIERAQEEAYFYRLNRDLIRESRQMNTGSPASKISFTKDFGPPLAEDNGENKMKKSGKVERRP